MTKPTNLPSIEKATGKPWSDWVLKIDAMGGQTMSHKDLARKLYDELAGTIENHGWWAQGITVAYEQYIGRRVPGQLSNGLFELAVSKTIALPRNDLYKIVCEWFEAQSKFNDQKPLKPRTSKTPKRSNWRCNFADGSKFAVTVEGDEIKSKLVLSHTDVPTKNQAEAWKIYWKSVIAIIENN